MLQKLRTSIYQRCPRSFPACGDELGTIILASVRALELCFSHEQTARRFDTYTAIYLHGTYRENSSLSIRACPAHHLLGQRCSDSGLGLFV